MVDFRHADNPEPFTAYRKEREQAAEPERFFPFEFEVWQGDEMVASASGPRDDALREAMHYAEQYEQDGPVRVFEVTRTLVRPNVEFSGGAPLHGAAYAGTQG